MEKYMDFLNKLGLVKNNRTFEPFGITCTKFKAGPMPCLDRHNEIEIMYALGGSVTYFFQERTITIPSHKMAILWGMFPHRIISVENADFFYIVSIPLSLFLGMGLPDSFVNRLFRGEVLLDEDSHNFVDYDMLLLDHWRVDLECEQPDTRAMLLELQGRLLRMSACVSSNVTHGQSLPVGEVDLVEQMTLYIAANCHRFIKVSDIGRAVGLHPDYANTIFKRVFGHTLCYHLMLERITQAQRKLLTTSDTVLQIAEACGFNSLSSFNSAFLKFNGCTPRDYRKHFRTADV